MAKKRNKLTKSNAPVEKDDGTRWVIEREDRPVYVTKEGTTRREAERLCAGLLVPAQMRQI